LISWGYGKRLEGTKQAGSKKENQGRIKGRGKNRGITDPVKYPLNPAINLIPPANVVLQR
jgi:hypothetical protein